MPESWPGASGRPRTVTVNGPLGTVDSGTGAYGTGNHAQRVYNPNECIWAALHSNGTKRQRTCTSGSAKSK
jgi:hypothetical protein